jgi:hypothetical protein
MTSPRAKTELMRKIEEQVSEILQEHPEVRGMYNWLGLRFMVVKLV